jgi:hypothetical protein
VLYTGKEIPLRILRLFLLIFCAPLFFAASSFHASAADAPLRVGTFVVDASPPIGSRLAYNRCDAIGTPLTARGIVLLGEGDPIVLCAVDWIGISNGGYEEWRDTIAKVAGTSPERVSIHALHQHDAPVCDFSAVEILEEAGYEGTMFDVEFARQTIANVADAAKLAIANAAVVTHVGLGEAKVEKVASNRRILGDDGKVRVVRYTATTDPAVRAEPEGLIDPLLKSISFWNDEDPLVVLTYYATHPQSYYQTGIASPDFPGMARSLRESTHNGLTHVHFNGAGGNIGAGKYNDGSHENRQVLAVRLAKGMADAYQATKKYPVFAKDVGWNTIPVALPVAPHLNEEDLIEKLNNSKDVSAAVRNEIAKDLVWLRRSQEGDTVDLTCLTLGPARILHMPGELAVEYQLAAQEMRNDLFVAMAAYGEYAPGYICMEEHYTQGGYEDSPGASKVAPQVEGVLMSALRALLK